MIVLICSILTLGAGVAATFVGDTGFAILALWVCGLGAGGLFLSQGAELLAIVQWIVSTLVSIAFIFHAVTFGEFNVHDHKPLSKKVVNTFLPVSAGICFAAVIWMGIKDLAVKTPLPGAEIGKPFGGGLKALGKVLISEHLLSIEILALTLFLVVIGAGVISRNGATTEERDK